VSAPSRRRSWLAVAAAVALLARADAAQAPRAAEPARLAARGLLIAIASAGERLVAVGDRGVIVLSDDHGASWQQAASVPVQALLTGVCFLDARHGIAVGHDAVILTSADAGSSWHLAHYDPQAQGPLLAVWCGAGGRAIAVGAYSAFFASGDGGASWSQIKFAPAPGRAAPAAAGRGEEAGGGYHLNRIVAGDGTRLYIAAEAGHLYRSEDLGGGWLALASPYEGSFFGVLPLGGDVLLAFGLRGNLFRSEDAGLSWRRLETGTVAMLNDGVRLDDRSVAIVGLSGVVLVSTDNGRSFRLRQQADQAGLAAANATSATSLAAVGDYGAERIELSALPLGSAR
jgi:photosystem II stability/assembly factor-like uncharacterized protein